MSLLETNSSMYVSRQTESLPIQKNTSSLKIDINRRISIVLINCFNIATWPVKKLIEVTRILTKCSLQVIEYIWQQFLSHSKAPGKNAYQSPSAVKYLSDLSIELIQNKVLVDTTSHKISIPHQYHVDFNRMYVHVEDDPQNKMSGDIQNLTNDQYTTLFFNKMNSQYSHRGALLLCSLINQAVIIDFYKTIYAVDRRPLTGVNFTFNITQLGHEVVLLVNIIYQVRNISNVIMIDGYRATRREIKIPNIELGKETPKFTVVDCYSSFFTKQAYAEKDLQKRWTSSI
ncbi:MAG: hypothetical protein H0W88_08060 [Parachlamydiaceae bacterium]|nr:hypothetical protein [Parachlamydiaceae bacterium]